MRFIGYVVSNIDNSFHCIDVLSHISSSSFVVKFICCPRMHGLKANDNILDMHCLMSSEFRFSGFFYQENKSLVFT